MSQSVSPLRLAQERARTLPVWVWGLCALTVACAGIGLLVTMPVLAAALGLSGLAAGATLATLRMRQSDQERRATISVGEVAELIAQDPVPAFVTSLAGHGMAANEAAKLCCGAEPRTWLQAQLKAHWADPSTRLDAMVLDAQQNGASAVGFEESEALWNLSIYRAGEALIWRINGGRGPKDALRARADSVAPARLITDPSGQLLDQSERMRAVFREDRRSFEALSSAQSGQILPLGAENKTFAVHRAQTEIGEEVVTLWPSDLLQPEISRTQFDQLPVPVLKLSPEGRVINASPLARSLLNGPEPEGMMLSALIQDLGRPVLAWVQEVVRGQSRPRTEIARVIHAAEETFVQVTLGAAEDLTGERHVVAILSDATELKTLEAKFAQGQKMQAIGQLAGGVAHDFNNLLTAISGHCDLLLLRRDHGDPDYADLVQINENANRAAALVGQLLAFSRKQNLHPEDVVLDELMCDLTHLLNRLVGEKITLRVTAPDDLPTIRADRRQLEQVMMNLVVNARDAMKCGGEISIDISREIIDAPIARDRATVDPGDWVVTRVRDEGSGIPADKIDKIFEPFFTTKNVGEGTGLGLSTVYGIVKQSGGYIFVDSQPGRGATFSLYFPAGEGQVETVPRPQGNTALPETESTGRILLVEDEAAVRAFAARALGLCGHEVIECASGDEALEVLSESNDSFDAFVSDVVMPGLDGPAWVGEALKTRPGTPVVFVSGYSEDQTTQEQAFIPNATFLQKPFSLNTFATTVAQAMAKT